MGKKQNPDLFDLIVQHDGDSHDIAEDTQRGIPRPAWPWPEIPETHSSDTNTLSQPIQALPQNEQPSFQYASINHSSISDVFTPEQDGGVARFTQPIGKTAAEPQKKQDCKKYRAGVWDNLITEGITLISLIAATAFATYEVTQWYNKSNAEHLSPPALSEMTASDLLRDGDPQVSLFENGDGEQLTVPLSHYLDYKRRNHQPRDIQDYARFVTPHDLYIQRLARQLLPLYPHSDRETVDSIIRFVHHLHYIDDPSDDDEYAKHPIETLVEQGGDCEDLTILAASLLLAAGQDVILLNYEGNGKGHMNLAVAGDYYGSHVEVDGRRYYIIEATDEALTIGDMPSFIDESYRIQVIRP